MRVLNREEREGVKQAKMTPTSEDKNPAKARRREED